MNAIAESEPSAVALTVMPRANGAERFQPLNLRLADHIAAAGAISISDEMPVEQQKAVAAQARRLRIDLFRALRIEAKNLHGEAKKGINEIGRTLDSAEREIRMKCEAEEARLYEIEEFQAKREQERRQRLHAERKETITPFLTGPVTGDLSGLSDEEFAAQLRDAQDGHAFREQQAEAQRVAREAAEARRREEEEAAAEKRRQEAEAQRVEQERVRREAEERRKEVERLKAEAAKAEAARVAELARLRKEQQAHEEAERKAREEAEERSRQQLRALEEKTRLEREAAERKAAAEAKAEAEKARKERERMHAEKMAAEAEARKAQAELDRKAKEEREAREAEAQAERARRNAPDIEKVRAFRYEVSQLELPALSAANAATAAAIAEQRTKFGAWLTAVISKMEGAK